MPNLGHFFPRSSYVDGGAAPGTAGKLGRSLANSSDVSLESHTQSDDEEQQFVLSGANTPAAETVPMDDAARRAGIPALRGGRGILDGEFAFGHSCFAHTVEIPRSDRPTTFLRNATRLIVLALLALRLKRLSLLLLAHRRVFCNGRSCGLQWFMIQGPNLNGARPNGSFLLGPG